MKIVGKSVKRIEGIEKATGRARFVSDYKFDGELLGGVLYARVPRARFVSIDTSEALKIPGVVAIATAKDVPGNNMMGSVVKDMPLLVPEDGEIRFEGDALALVAAKSKQALSTALKSIRVRLEALEPVLSLDDAVRTTQVVNGEKNVAFHKKIRRGSVKEAFEKSHLIVESEFETDYQEHAYLETQGAVAVYEPEGIMKIYCSMQCPFYVQKDVAEVLGFPLNKVQAIQTETGGAFGGKEDVPSWVAAKAALLSFLTRKPVKIIYSREDDIMETSKRHPSKSLYRVGFSKNGSIMAVEAKIYLDMGAYSTLSPIVMYRTLTHACGAYSVPNVKVDVFGVYTNKVPCGAFRGFGSPQVLFAMESVMDMAASKMGMDPFEIRMRNSLDVGSETSTGQKLKNSVGARKTLINVKKISNYDKLRKEVDEFNRTHRFKKRGLGLSHIIYGVSLGAAGRHLDASCAQVHVHTDGTVTISIGGTEMGQGAKTVVAMIAAEVLGQRIEKISVTQPDTFIVQDSGPTVASRTTVFTGNAVKIAASKIRDSMVNFIREKYSFPVSVGYGYFQVGDKKIDFDEISEICSSNNVKMCETGWYVSPKLDFDFETGTGEAYVTYSFASQLSMVEVDTMTGKTDILEVWVSHDVGKAINFEGVVGQIQGGIVQGMGFAFMEKLVLDNGRISTLNFNNYTVPTVRDVPKMHIDIVEDEFPHGPFGAKGIGEPSLMSCPPSIANAISDAVGRRVRVLPAEPEYVLSLIERW